MSEFDDKFSMVITFRDAGKICTLSVPNTHLNELNLYFGSLLNRQVNNPAVGAIAHFRSLLKEYSIPSDLEVKDAE